MIPSRSIQMAHMAPSMHLIFTTTPWGRPDGERATDPRSPRFAEWPKWGFEPRHPDSRFDLLTAPYWQDYSAGGKHSKTKQSAISHPKSELKWRILGRRGSSCLTAYLEFCFRWPLWKGGPHLVRKSHLPLSFITAYFRTPPLIDLDSDPILFQTPMVADHGFQIKSVDHCNFVHCLDLKQTELMTRPCN